jgi:hypothetical protein
MAEQFTSYGTLQDNGEEVPNPAGERLNSWITQFVAGYTLTPRLAAQINLPLIGRAYRRQETSSVVNGDETGIGDMALLLTGAPLSLVTQEIVARWSATFGLKFPTGNSRRLKEEVSELQPPESADDPFNGHTPPSLVKYHTSPDGGAVPSGVHGHDLALGSGSTDAVLGTQLFGSWQRLFVTGEVQYAIRTEGSFGYEYANDLIWSGGPGVFGVLEHDFTLGLQAIVSGEAKGTDTVNGAPTDDTARTALYVGPEIVLTWGTSAGFDFAFDQSVVQNNSGLQVVPDYRFRAGLTWRF